MLWSIDTNSAGYCDHQLYQWQRDYCFINIATSFDDISYCYKITNKTYQNDCARNYALKHKRLDICDNLSDLQNKHSCYNGIGIKTNNISLCSKYGEPKYDCVKYFVLAQNDSRLCDKLYITAQDHCKLEMAIKNKNLTICENITDYGYKSLCFKEPERNWT